MKATRVVSDLISWFLGLNAIACGDETVLAHCPCRLKAALETDAHPLHDLHAPLIHERPIVRQILGKRSSSPVLLAHRPS